MPKTWRTDTFMSGRPGTASGAGPVWVAGASMKASLSLRVRALRQANRRRPVRAFLKQGADRTQFHGCPNAGAAGGFVASAQAGGLEGVVRLDDVAQALLEGAVAAVGVGVESLHQRLVLRLDAGGVRRLVEAEHVQSPAHGSAESRSRRVPQ